MHKAAGDFRDRQQVCYEDFGAVGDGKADDFAAIRQAHDYANAKGLRVVSDPTKTYYIGPSTQEAVIQTDTDWSSSRFIIDDREIPPERRGHSVFVLASARERIPLEGIQSIRKNQLRLDVALPGNAVVIATQESHKQFRRVGLNQSAGYAQTDCFLVDGTGTLLSTVLWDFTELSSLVAYPMDERLLTLQGGIFTTLANRAESRYTYYARGIRITRSNVLVQGLVHGVEEELDHGAPYHGFVRTEDCARVRFQDCHFTGHKIYRTIGAANLPVDMGSYDISLFRSIDISFHNCHQDNILDRSLWGVFTSNYCKQILVDGCTFSRVDAHMNVTDYTIRNSTIGHQGLKAIGHGRMTVENVTSYGNSVVELRGDYGSTWDGELILRNITWYPGGKYQGMPCVITGSNPGNHDFGYPCAMPGRVTLENLTVLEAHLGGGEIALLEMRANEGLSTFDAPGVQDHPYGSTQRLVAKGLKTQTGNGFSLWSAPPTRAWLPKPHRVTEGAITPNFKAHIQDADAISIELTAEPELFGENHRLVPEITLVDCGTVRLNLGNAPVRIEED